MKYRAAIIGMGNHATKTYLPGFQHSHLAQLRAVCDIDSEKLVQNLNHLEVTIYKDYIQMLDSEDLDFVIITTPHNMHREIVEAAAERGVHILKEKPFARSLEEASHLKRICEDAGVHLMVTLQRRFDPIYMNFLQMKDQIGDIFFFEAKYTLFVDSPGEGWRGNVKQAGGGCILDMGYHLIDVLIWNFGLPESIVTEFSSRAHPDDKYDAEDTALISIRYENGLYGSLILSRYYPPKTELLRVVGNKGIVEVEKDNIRKLKNNGEVVESLVREHSWPMAATQIDYFCKVIRGERENIGSANCHLQHLAFIEACYQSRQNREYINPKKLLLLKETNHEK
jgi:predicted dehydrogenase